MSVNQYDDNFENFDIEDFDEDFDEDFEAEVAGEYELENSEYQDFDDPSMIPTVDFCGESDDEEEPVAIAEDQEPAADDSPEAEPGESSKSKPGKKTGK
ncbi:MAG: hypothetical protein JNK57_11570 [Planctomycetaceae bacterium]|nr:hypothetical protein [Planctomycetaceae bacterium]